MSPDYENNISHNMKSGKARVQKILDRCSYIFEFIERYGEKRLKDKTFCTGPVALVAFKILCDRVGGSRIKLSMLEPC